MKRGLVLVLWIGGLGIFSWVTYSVYDEAIHVNEPRITQRHVEEVKKQFGGLISDDARDLRVVWIELDAGTTVFQYHTHSSIKQLLKHASVWKPTNVEDNYAEIVGGNNWLHFGQIWRLSDRVVISLSGKEYLLTDPDRQSKIRMLASLP